MARKTNRGVAVVPKLDDRSYARAMKTLGKYEGSKFRNRVIKAFTAGARLLVAPMRRLAPYERGGLAKSIAVRRDWRTRAIIKIGVKPRAPKGAHGHLHSKGHRIVGGSGQEAGYFKGNLFVQRTIQKHEGRVIRFIQEQPLDIGGTTAGFASNRTKGHVGTVLKSYT